MSKTLREAAHGEWQSVVFTLMGHAASLYADGQHDMPAWFYALAETIAREHVDEHHALRAREVGVQMRAKYVEPKEDAALAAEVEAQPVAWRYVPSKAWKDTVLTDDAEKARLATEYGCEVTPLYPPPQPAIPAVMTKGYLDAVGRALDQIIEQHGNWNNGMWAANIARGARSILNTMLTSTPQPAEREQAAQQPRLGPAGAADRYFYEEGFSAGVRSTQQPSQSQGEHPPLPEPDTHCFDDDTGKDVWSFSADLMHAYLEADRAQRRAVALTDEQVERVVRSVQPHLDSRCDAYKGLFNQCKYWMEAADRAARGGAA